MEPAPSAPSLRKKALAALVFTVCFALVLFSLHALGLLEWLRRAETDKEAFRSEFRDFGGAAVWIFFAVLAVRPLTLIPGVWLAPVAAVLFGPWLGAVYKVLGETIAACVAFAATRFGLKRFVRSDVDQESQHLLARIDETLERRSFLAVLALRLNLLIPYDLLNFGLGVTRVRFVPYMLGTLLGIVPGTFAYVLLSDKAIEGDWRITVLLIAGIALMIVLAVPFTRDLLRKPEDEEAAAD